ncbi:MAG TPA: diaminopimelate epimerase [Candidatus Kapabacteria bacterium]|jgi:diaminopimelate epimerase|nr:diaminopimelate epimerase [Candidatus Kapabacteria bacterium]
MTHGFQRYTGAGNTFVVMNTWEDPLSLSREEMRMFVRKACDYEEGIGSDGVILINQPAISSKSIAEFRMDFYNPDGTTGMLCGNGARCAVAAAREYGFVTSDAANFEVLGAVNRAEAFTNGNIKVYFQEPSVIRLNFELPLEEGKSIAANYVDLGSQHVVVFFNDLSPLLSKEGVGGGKSIEDFNIAHYGPLLRWHPEFAPVGANANIIELREDGEDRYLRIRTWERGVEGETLACGTGCMSSAIVARLTGRIPKTPIRLLTQSGEYVTVDFTVEGNAISNLSLEGSAIRGEEGMAAFDEKSGTLEIEYR